MDNTRKTLVIQAWDERRVIEGTMECLDSIINAIRNSLKMMNEHLETDVEAARLDQLNAMFRKKSTELELHIKRRVQLEAQLRESRRARAFQPDDEPRREADPEASSSGR